MAFCVDGWPNRLRVGSNDLPYRHRANGPGANRGCSSELALGISSCFPALGISSCFPELDISSCFPALCTIYVFPRLASGPCFWRLYRLHIFLCLAPVSCFLALGISTSFPSLGSGSRFPAHVTVMAFCVDGRPNRTKTVAFSYLSGLVWTGPNFLPGLNNATP